jgi:hypothetical protein
MDPFARHQVTAMKIPSLVFTPAACCAVDVCIPHAPPHTDTTLSGSTQLTFENIMTGGIP